MQAAIDGGLTGVGLLQHFVRRWNVYEVVTRWMVTMFRDSDSLVQVCARSRPRCV